MCVPRELRQHPKRSARKVSTEMRMTGTGLPKAGLAMHNVQAIAAPSQTRQVIELNSVPPVIATSTDFNHGIREPQTIKVQSMEMGSRVPLGARFWALIGATFLGFLGIGAVLPGLGPHVRHDLGGSDQTVGFVIGTFSFVALAGRFVSGPLADRAGERSLFWLAC